MTVSITHPFVSPSPQGADSTRVYGPQWNSVHSISGPANTIFSFDGSGNPSTATAALVMALPGLVANSTQARAGTDSTILTTPLGVSQAIASLILPAASVATYGGAIDGSTSYAASNAESTTQTGKERYTLWVGQTGPGTSDSSPGATTFAAGVSNIKQNWTSSTAASVGETGGLNIVVRGGGVNTATAGDTIGVQYNIIGSQDWNNISIDEGVVGYAPQGAFSTGLLYMNLQRGVIRNHDNAGVGYYAKALNGTLGTAFQATNDSVGGTYSAVGGGFWSSFLTYIYSDGNSTHPAYTAFGVNSEGKILLSQNASVSNPKKYLGVDSSGNFVIINNAGTAQYFFSDAGTLTAGGAVGVGPSAGYALIGAGGIAVFNGTALATGGQTGSGIFVSSVGNLGLMVGSGAPTASAHTGTLYLRSDGSNASNRAYINTGTTNWTALTTQA